MDLLTARPTTIEAPDRPTDGASAPDRRPATPAVAQPWLRAQAINVARHAAALRPFRRDEFGTQAAAPTEAHIQAVNNLIALLRRDLLQRTNGVRQAVATASAAPSTAHLQTMVSTKARAHDSVQAVERVWDFYFELFGQRQSQFGDWLLSCDRIALDCYQAAYIGLGTARSIPAPPPYAYMRTGFSPATFRRGIPLRRLGQQLNPFPLVQLPYHRLVNPWTLGAVLHEVSHNLQNDLGLAQVIPRAIAQALLRAGHSRLVATTWTRWNRETFADLCGLLLGGPAVVGSLLDVIGRSPEMVLTYGRGAPHPTPYLRAFISIELLRRLGFPAEAARYRTLWTRLYPASQAGNLPTALLDEFPAVIATVVATICYRPYPSLGDRCLAEVIRFSPKEQQMVDEAARRLASGTDPGIIPARFLIGAARTALDRRLARPGTITTHFYKELARR